MAVFKIDLSTAFVFVVVPPAPKLVNKQTGEIAIDRETGAKLLTVGLTIADDGDANLYTVTVPETGVSDGLAVGMPVAVTGLKARDWENEVNGQKRHGIAFRAMAITSIAPAAVRG
ncbi:SCO3933 family regulatory protein [Kitasatospora griseola]|uniref:SCO3933 family regulatory protein n=1 Tax=Kitasatospora griseola TaxID=2064 RepID=UPI0038185084